MLLDYSVSCGPSFEFLHWRLRLEMDQDPNLTKMYNFKSSQNKLLVNCGDD